MKNKKEKHPLFLSMEEAKANEKFYADVESQISPIIMINSKGEIMKDITSEFTPCLDCPKFEWKLNGDNVVKATILEIDGKTGKIIK